MKRNEEILRDLWENINCINIHIIGVPEEPWQRLTEFCQENTLVIANTLFQQHKRRLYTWTSPDGQHQNQIDYIFAKMEKSYTVSKKQDQELTVAQIMSSLLPNSDLN